MTIPGTSGHILHTPLAFYDPDSGSLKTSQLTLLWASATSSPILPASGAMRNGAVYERPASEPRTSGTASSSSLGSTRALPTPAARDWRGEGQDGQLPTAIGTVPAPGAPIRPGGRRPRCPTAAALLLPTPSTSEATGPGHTGRAGGMSLRTAVDLLLPTPRASPNEDRQTRRTPSQEAGTHGRSLAAEVCTVAADAPSRNLRPAPAGIRLGRKEATRARTRQCSGRRTSGGRMPTPWPDGPLSSAVPHRDQLTLWDA
ncbi:hypothetical protein GCM10010357_51750 [Streptomyces luteireticuli]|uniref:Uncharacterized protein n=1 Tax=Streptomyces luteireticuli TaxID=173858 RepID=A0ABN0YZX2_9ACTN